MRSTRGPDGLPSVSSIPREEPAGLERLGRGQVLHGEALDRWTHSTIGIAGAGLLGSRIALEIVRSGASVRIYDPDTAEESNLATQVGLRAGAGKAAALCESCDAVVPGRASGAASDWQARPAGGRRLALAWQARFRLPQDG